MLLKINFRGGIIVAGLCAVGTSHAIAQCSKIDYADAKDWPVDKAEKQYCFATKMAESKLRLLKDVRTSGLLLPPSESRATNAAISECIAQSEMFGRVIENVHKRPLPNCPS